MTAERSSPRLHWRSGTVSRVVSARPGLLDVLVDLTTPLGGRTSVRALAYTDLVGTPQVADRVLLTVNALSRGLGTGGHALVAGLPDHLPPDPQGQPGHLVKARYMPLQPMVLGVDEQESEHHALLRDADDLAGMPVVVADLHSALPAVLCGIRTVRPQTRVAYLMTDGGALPAVLSHSLAGLTSAGWLTGCLTVGQAFGGDLEAVTVHTGLLAARLVMDAEVVVVTQGPGNLGTGTRWGFSGVASGDAVNAIGTLGGRPVASLRVSATDPRERHRGVSHHSLTAYGRVALVPADVVVPELGTELGALVRSQVAPLGPPVGRHRLVREPVDGLAEALATSPVPLTTMGRTCAEDPVPFLAAAAAGRHAANLLLSGVLPDRPAPGRHGAADLGEDVTWSRS